jgi:hypothetical protein
MDALARNRKSQNMFAYKLRRQIAKQRSVDSTVTALSDGELESRIRLAAESLRQTPRSGLRRWLQELIREKDARAMRKKHHAAPE